MKLLSFDVGIKNLAYCLIDETHQTIEDWGILNISSEPVCEHQMKDRCCDKTAKFIVLQQLMEHPFHSPTDRTFQL